MNGQFPPIEPYDSGIMAVGGGHEVYWECCGNPHGIPALFLHGGPGGGCSPGQRRFFDPSVYRIVVFDQRGCGRSRPLASEPDADLSTNTTAHLLADIELLRQSLHVERWTILGLSWGTTLGLAYAETHPDRIRALVLALVTTTSRREVEWITKGVGSLFPREWDRFATAVPIELRHLPIVDAYATCLFDADPLVRGTAAREWCAWEDAHVSLTPGHRPHLETADPQFQLRLARLVTHYWRHAAFLPENQLLSDAPRLNGIPGVLIHGRYDVSSPLETAWELARRWTTGNLQVLDDAGHGGGASFHRAVVGALSSFAS